VDDFKYHIDHHASLVRPPDLSTNVDHAITDAVLRQRRLGLLAMSDGEYRRRNDLAVVYDAVAGFGEPGLVSRVAQLVGPAHAAEVRPLLTMPVPSGRLAQTESSFLAGVTTRSRMLALPAPGFLCALAGNGGESAQSVAGIALAEIIRDEIAALAADGIGYVLLRNPALGFLLTQNGRAQATSLGLDPDKTIAAMVEIDNTAIAGLDLPANFCLGLDLTTAGVAEGAWDGGAIGDFLSRQTFARLCVEHRRDAPFPVDLLTDRTVVSLGVIDIASPEVDDIDEVLQRIDKAAEIISIDAIAVATNGGFHAVPTATADREHAKLQAVEMVANYIWGNEL
jgi:5-methyltetrahydropteroyltriglutamate--homocysteine methyltransferase